MFLLPHVRPYLICASPCVLLRGDCWMSEDGAVEIKEGNIVRLRIIGLNIDAGVIVSSCTSCSCSSDYIQLLYMYTLIWFDIF